jgi:predicted RNase H-like nuclease (RuvC/YqgF family)
MTDSIYTIALLTIASGMTIIAGISAYLYRQRDGQFEAAAKRCNELADENEQYETALATSEATVKGLRETQAQLERIVHMASTQLDRLHAERANLYFRNAKGQIEPITPKPRKPHTLKHGMTVKDPTPEQAKRIFREARKAGIETGGDSVATHVTPYLWFNGGRVCMKTNAEYPVVTYITPTEFIRRIRGEHE